MDRTRERIIRLLLAGPLTVTAMARALGVTRNAVRAQVALLRREGVVEPRGEVKGARRPSVLYGLLPGADAQLSRAYPSLVSHLVRVLSEELPPRAFVSAMKKTGRLLASGAPRATGDVVERARSAVRFLGTLGSRAEVTEDNGKCVITSDGCPIGAAVGANVRACSSMQAMLQELTGLDVDEQCRHGALPQCRFVVGAPPRGSGGLDPHQGNRPRLTLPYARAPRGG